MSDDGKKLLKVADDTPRDPRQVSPGLYTLTVPVEVDNLGTVKFARVGLDPWVIAEAGGSLTARKATTGPAKAPESP